MVRYRGPIILLISLFFLFSCAGGWGIIGSPQEIVKLTPKAQATVFMDTYMRENKDLQSLSALGASATPAQNKLFLEKQKILVKMKPYLDLYISVAKAGGVPDQTTTNQLNDFINQLVAATGGL